jgi:phosphoglycolate phosphatase
LKIVGLDNHYAHSKVENGLRWLAELPFEREEILFVGDTEHDYEVARAMGVDCVLVAGGHQTRQALARTGVRILNSVEEIMSLTAADVQS